jgi:cyanophycinase
MKLDRLGDFTSELSSNLAKSIVLPSNLLEWLTRPLDRLRGAARGSAGREGADTARSAIASGPILLMGGAPVPDEAIVAMIHLAGDRNARLAVIPVAATEPEKAAEQGVRLFTRFGMRKVQVFELTARERANDPEWAAQLAQFDAVFLCGDSVSRGLEVLRETLCAQTLREMLSAGKPISGLDAGAVILGERILLSYDPLEITEGLGLAPGMVVETSFTQEARFSHLAKSFSAGKVGTLLGVGLDAGTAVALRAGEAKVLGEGSVTFLDPLGALPADTAASSSLCELKVHVLTDGYGLSLRTRKPISPVREPAPVAADR